MRHQRSLKLALVVGIFGLLVVTGSVAGASTAGVKIRESNDKYHFVPATAFVNVGGTVTWTNVSDAPHTVTSDSGSELGSSNVGAGKTYSHQFGSTGTFAYHCTIHSYMTGKVVVLAAGATPPATDTVALIGTPGRNPPVAGLVLLVVGILATLVALAWSARQPRRRASTSPRADERS
jgi:plastocyanin